MVRKVEIKPSNIGSDGGSSTEIKEIVEYVLDPSPEKLAGMTRLQLDMVRPCSFARTFIDAMLEHCDLAKESQKAYSKNWAVWHSEDWEIQGIGKRFPPDPELKEDSFKGDNKHEKFLDWVKTQEEKHKDTDEEKRPRFFQVGYKPEIIDISKNGEFKIRKIEDTLVYKYLHQLYLHRRSTTPIYTDRAFDLAERQMENKTPESEYRPFREQ